MSDVTDEEIAAISWLYHKLTAFHMGRTTEGALMMDRVKLLLLRKEVTE